MTFSYPGLELDLFQHATNWKRYYARILRPYISGAVLEVGAGFGGTSRFLCDGRQESWTCLEPDTSLVARLRRNLADMPLPIPHAVAQGTLADDVVASRSFDTVLYVDVLEHIEDDYGELARAAGRLRPHGHVIVLAPAHNWLYSPFDRAIGHYRRYSRRTLIAASSDGLVLVRAFYLDSFGLFASLGNKALLRKAYPTLSQIRFWDSTLVPISRMVDPLLGHRVGRTVVTIWERSERPHD
jgi:SAM-dependent methyltransferase